MVFLLIIFALLLRVFQLTIESSQMEHKIRILVEELAIRDKAVQVSEKKDTRWTEKGKSMGETGDENLLFPYVRIGM